MVTFVSLRNKFMKFFGMKRILMLIMLTIGAFTMAQGIASAQTDGQKRMDPEDYAEKETERLEASLGLEGWQTFYVDSILRNNYVAMQEEIDEMRAAKVDNYNLYLSVQDKWLEKTDSAFMKYFTPEQWSRYLKSGAARQQKARAKRAAKSGK